AAADDLLKQSGEKNLDALEDEICKPPVPKPHSFIVKGAYTSGSIHIQRDQRSLKNVVAYLPGHGSHKNEFIVVGAHYDHLGRGELGAIGRSKDIYNGADDNGSGTVAVIELAKKMAGHPRDRS